MIDLKGKVALVTGAKSGIGAACSKTLARLGAKVILSGRLFDDCLNTVNAINLKGGLAKELYCDLSGLAKIPEFIERALNIWGRIDIVINNGAVITPMAKVSCLNVEEFDMAIKTNLSAPCGIISSAWKTLTQTEGRVINILSGAATRPITGWAAYCSSKAGLLMLTKQVHLEGYAHGIKCFGFAPGIVNTNMQVKIREAKINEVSQIPQKELPTALKPAENIAILASGRADHFSGDMVHIRDTKMKELHKMIFQ